MTVSKQERGDDIDLALRLFVEAVGDLAFDAITIASTAQPFKAIMQTTWSEMQRRGWVHKVDIINSTGYWIIGPGWREAVFATGLADDANFKASLGRLAAALKDSVKGRR